MSNQYFLARFAGRDPNIRASDADRERVAERLRTGHAEGRLDLAEFQQRLESCYEAKTQGQLSELVTDLPRPDEPQERGQVSRIRFWRWRLVPVAPLLIALIVVAAASEDHFFWVWIPLGFFLWRIAFWRRRRGWGHVRRGPADWI